MPNEFWLKISNLFNYNRMKMMDRKFYLDRKNKNEKNQERRNTKEQQIKEFLQQKLEAGIDLRKLGAKAIAREFRLEKTKLKNADKLKAKKAKGGAQAKTQKSYDKSLSGSKVPRSKKQLKQHLHK